ncbi:MAG: flavodoxin-dependent (E)-4-hydroxy-3-methylbut-2-enyl-diphosphate synthase [Gammaproteobacteria bacterium]|nr:flavodoxin-dependent (E)-4-hydroxy-3-methylbut-2-enyl-diphosphate synthase [Gammaproteobacteria bacterium]
MNTESIPDKLAVQIGEHLTIGAGHPVVVQAMTNTATESTVETAVQIKELADAGAEMVRVTVNTRAAAEAVPRIRERLETMGVDVPLVGDFHFNGHKLLAASPDCAQALDKLRINPGNVGRAGRRDKQFAQMIEIACRFNKPVRIGVNWGSLDQDLLADMLDANQALSEPKPLEEITRQALVRSALDSAERAVELGLAADRIIISCKTSEPKSLLWVYRELHRLTPCPLHLGLTEAGMGRSGIVKSAAPLAILLDQSIGDTIRVSITPEPGGDRCEEVRVARDILQTLGLRRFSPDVAACPGCGRTTSEYFQYLAQDVQAYLEENMPQWRADRPRAAEMNVAVMGCVVNGPGESQHANIGISLPGTGEKPVAVVYIDGQRHTTLTGDSVAADFKTIIENYVTSRY